MKLSAKWFTFATALFQRSRIDSEMDEELRAHIQSRAEDLIRSGLSRAEAERRARLEFGGYQKFKEECREAAGVHFFETLLQDLRFALRMLRKSPGFAAVAVLTLALGIGANTAIFSVVDGVLLKPLPYPHPEQLVTINISPLAVDPHVSNMAPEDYFIFREQSRSFQDIGIYLGSAVNITGMAEPERANALGVTHDVLSVLGIPPLLGRTFSASDDSPGAPLTAVLTYGYWRRKFGGDSAAVGKTIIVDGEARQIIGVMPQTFRFLDVQDLALLLPLQLDRNKTLIGNFSFYGIARLKNGNMISQADSDAERLLPVVLRSFPIEPGLGIDIFEKAHLAPRILPLKDEVVGNVGTFLWVLMGGIGIVLLIACANIANLLLVRTEGRQQELAVRAALGASRARIAAELLTESAMIGLLGSLLGTGLAWAALRYLVALAPSGLPRIGDIGLNSTVLLFALAIGLITSLLFGAVPVLKHSKAGAAAGLRAGDRTLSQNRQRHRASNMLVTAQVGLALVLLVCSGLMIRTFRALIHVNPGFARPAELQTFRISIPRAGVPDDLSVPRVEQQIEEKLAAIPGVSSVSFSSAVPLDGNNYLYNVFAEDHTYSQGKLPPFSHMVFISPGYMSTMGTPLIAGRDLTWTDTYKQLPVALVSENFAREYWGTAAGALGKRIRIAFSDDWRQIIGVVGDVHDQGMDRPARPAVYWPVLLSSFQGTPLRVQRYISFAVRSPLAGTESLMNQIRQAVWSVNANLPLAGVFTLGDLYLRSMARTSFTLVMLGIAGAMALLLGTIGLYGVIAYSVSQRTREIGIRLALGAQRRSIMKMVLRQGLGLAAAGTVVGLVGALVASRLISRLLYGVSPSDPLTFAAVALVLAIVALIASYIPARRAMRVDPIVALRYE